MRVRTLAGAFLAGATAACASVPAQRTAEPIPLRAMTYNIRSGNGNLDSTAAAIRAEAPDLVGLQEVDVHWAERSEFADQATELGAKLGMQVRFAHIYDLPNPDTARPRREFGVALLSRYPFTNFRNDTITRLSTQDSSPPRPMPGLLDATVDVHGVPVRVFDTHLDYRRDPRVRAMQVADMLTFVDRATGPIIVLGDMNATPTAPELAPLLARLRDAWAAAANVDSGFTYPADAPTERIDYVLVSREFTVRAARVPPTQASDHRPVVVDLALARREP